MEKVGRGRPRKTTAENIENQEKVQNVSFEPIIIKFDDEAFSSEIEEQNEIIEAFNEVINDLHSVYEIKMTDEEIKKHIIERESLSEFTSKLFINDHKVKRIRELAQNEVLEVLEDFKERVRYKYPSKENFIVQNGVISLSKEFIERTRQKHTYSIDSPRAKEIYDLHQKAVEIVCKIRSMAREKGLAIEIGTLFEYDREYNIKARELKYNLL